MQRGEYEYATHTNERTAASYFRHNFVPLAESGLVDFSTASGRSCRGIRAIPTPGHTPHHQGLLIESDGEQAFYIADLAPTVAHLPLPWIMGYDVEPLVTLETKRRILKRAVEEDWLVVFEHDADYGVGQDRARWEGIQVRELRRDATRVRRSASSVTAPSSRQFRLAVPAPSIPY